MLSKMIFAASVCAALSACSVREGRLALPADLESDADRLELRGMGGGRKGNFRLAGVPGTFTRSAARQEIFESVWVRNRGGGTFSLAASPLNPNLSGRCRYREGELNVGPVSVTPDQLVYECIFHRDGRPIAAELMIADPKPALGNMHGRAERIGYLYIEGQEIAIRSVHHDERGGLATPIPLGYVFEDGGRKVGAVDLNGPDKTIYAPRNSELREAVIAAGLALSIFWDPADLHSN